MPFRVSRVQLDGFHDLNQVFKVSITLLDGKINEVLILVFIVIGDQVRVKINHLQKLDLLISQVIMLYKHPLDGNDTPVKGALKHNSATTAQS